MRNNLLKFFLIISLFACFGQACSSNAGAAKKSFSATKTETVNTKIENAEKVQSCTLRGINFSYYKIPAGLDREKLVETARAIHEAEPDAQLILVDDASGVADYVKYAQEFSKGNMDARLPKEWADKHVVANLQKLMNGKWRLYEGYGYNEIADLE